MNGVDNYIPAFSERVLLSKTFLNVLHPSECKEKRIPQISNALFESIANSPVNPYDVKLKGPLHSITKPFRAALRVASIALVILGASTCGVFYSGTMFFIKLKWDFKRETNAEIKGEIKERAKQYAKAFFTDLKCLLIVGIACLAIKTMAVNLIHLSKGFYFNAPVNFGSQLLASQFDKLLGIATLAAGSIGTSLFLGAVNPTSFLSSLSIDPNRRLQLHLSLTLREKLGLVDENGNLLKASPQDKVLYDVTRQLGVRPIYIFKGQFFETLKKAELELLQLVIDADEVMLSKDLPSLALSYPFNGNEVAALLEQHVHKTPGGSSKSDILVVYDSTHKLIADLKKVQFKVETLKGLFLSSLQAETWVQFSKEFCAVNKKDYEKYFEEGIPGNHVILDDFYDKIDLPSLDPDTESQPSEDDTYHLFLYKLRINKWYIENDEEPDSLESLIGLKNEYTAEEKKAAYKKYSTALHPDKNGSSDEAKNLFQFLNQIKTQLDKD